MEYFWLIIIGLIAGIISSFFGIGGGLIIVPSLLLVFPKIEYSTVVGSSLAIIFFNTIINTYNFSKKGLLPPISFIRDFIFGVLPGVLIGTYLVSHLPSSVSKKIFAVFLIFIVIYSHYKSRIKSVGEEVLEGKMLVKIISGGFAGIIAGLTGIGGGTVLIPVLMSVFHFKPKKLSPTSNSIMIFLTGIAMVRMLINPAPEFSEFASYQVGSVNFFIVLIVFIGTFITSKLGVWLNSICKDQVKKIIFDVMLLSLSLKLFLT